jgi:hypothetical protein
LAKKKMTPADRDFVDSAVAGDKQGSNDALVEMHRDPALWFCSGIDEHDTPRMFGLGDTEVEAEANAREAAEGYIAEKAAFRVMAPVTDWRFISYAPDPPPA